MDKKETKKIESSTEGKMEAGSLVGVVVSDKMKDTSTVLVKRYVKLPKYGKYVNKSKKYLAHDPGNTKKIGDSATIVPCRPISKRKTFKIVK